MPRQIHVSFEWYASFKQFSIISFNRLNNKSYYYEKYYTLTKRFLTLLNKCKSSDLMHLTSFSFEVKFRLRKNKIAYVPYRYIRVNNIYLLPIPQYIFKWSKKERPTLSDTKKYTDTFLLSEITLLKLKIFQNL